MLQPSGKPSRLTALQHLQTPEKSGWQIGSVNVTVLQFKHYHSKFTLFK